MIVTHKRLNLILLTCLAILLIPVFLTTFSQNFQWGISDFVIAGVLLVGFGLSVEFTLRYRKSGVKVLLPAFLLILLFLLTWAELGVGIFGTSLAGN